MDQACVYYLAQKYTGCEAQAFELACEVSNKLISKGFIVFSPIAHSHPIHNHNTANGIDWVAFDLRLIKGWLKHDIFDCYWLNRNCADFCPDDPEDCPHFQESKFDSGLVMLFADSCFQYLDEDPVNIIWQSKGAQKEYAWAKQHHVRCLLLTPFLDDKEVEI